MSERLSCPSQSTPRTFDEAGFVGDVEVDRCPVSGCGLVPFERADGSAVVTTGRCDPAGGGCGAEWALDEAGGVRWWGREVALDFDWPEDGVGAEGDGG